MAGEDTQAPERQDPESTEEGTPVPDPEEEQGDADDDPQAD
ncbi:MAG TPA: hypothetical protein VFW80_07135 [Gaiellaceae bacterium]|nr:hypothetical protein [Gaiellaceae bacterium]